MKAEFSKPWKLLQRFFQTLETQKKSGDTKALYRRTPNIFYAI